MEMVIVSVSLFFLSQSWFSRPPLFVLFSLLPFVSLVSLVSLVSGRFSFFFFSPLHLCLSVHLGFLVFLSSLLHLCLFNVSRALFPVAVCLSPSRPTAMCLFTPVLLEERLEGIFPARKLASPATNTKHILQEKQYVQQDNHIFCNNEKFDYGTVDEASCSCRDNGSRPLSEPHPATKTYHERMTASVSPIPPSAERPQRNPKLQCGCKNTFPDDEAEAAAMTVTITMSIHHPSAQPFYLSTQSMEACCGKVRVSRGTVRVSCGEVRFSCNISCGKCLSVASFLVCARSRRTPEPRKDAYHGHGTTSQPILTFENQEEHFRIQRNTQP